MGGFAGHCDWRVPTVVELQTIADPTASGCGSGSPCIDPVFGPTVADFYLSSTTVADIPGSNAWCVYFYVGVLCENVESGTHYVRAVRGGL
jgi:hypothetical protein